MPNETMALLDIANIRLRCRRAGIARIDAGPNGTAVTPRPEAALPDVADAERRGLRIVFPDCASTMQTRLAVVTRVLDRLQA